MISLNATPRSFIRRKIKFNLLGVEGREVIPLDTRNVITQTSPTGSQEAIKQFGEALCSSSKTSPPATHFYLRSEIGKMNNCHRRVVDMIYDYNYPEESGKVSRKKKV